MRQNLTGLVFERLTVLRQAENGRVYDWLTRCVCGVRITAFGETKTLVEWSRDPRCKVSSTKTIQARLRTGFSPEIALIRPPTSGNFGHG